MAGATVADPAAIQHLVEQLFAKMREGPGDLCYSFTEGRGYGVIVIVGDDHVEVAKRVRLARLAIVES